MVAKKYKLFAASSENGGTGPCAFFASEAGCRNGDKCKFLHVLPDSAIKGEAISSSDVSSESEGEVDSPVPDPALKSVATQSQESQTSAKKKNKKKRKHVDSSADIFATPKNHNQNKEAPETHQSGGKKQKVSQKKPNPNQSQNSPPPPAKAEDTVADFRNLNLPIMSFTINGKTATATPAPTAVKTETTPSPPALPLPRNTPTGLKWQKAILKTREHARYAGSFDFEKMKETDEEAGLGNATDWITARQFGPWCKENPQAIALDCEMCETRDPVSGAVDSKALCRVSIVNADNPDEVLLDSLVKPTWPVVDYRSRINGIKEEHLANVQFTLRHAQAFLMALCSDETVLLGHALHNDLAALKMEHHCIVDSSFLFPVKDAPNATPSLKDLAANVLKKDMPQTHDSVNDANAALSCLETYVTKKGKVAPIERSVSRNTLAASQLFVHRIPKHCQASHLETMFLAHTSVQPKQVDEVEFNGDTGRTHVTFRSSRHANLAFDSLESKEEADKSGRMQKKVYLKNGGYVRVRMMVHPRTPRRESSGGTPRKESSGAVKSGEDGK